VTEFWHGTGRVAVNDAEPLWQVRRGEEVVAELVVTGGDFPWLNALLRPAPGFEQVRPLFQEELRALERIDHPGAWETAYENIRGAVTLDYPDGRPVPEFPLHIDGQDAWWRWRDEPFTKPEAGA
jgi:hypothetical protein